MGIYSDNPTPVDAKQRLKLLMLSWGGKCSADAPVQMEKGGSELSSSQKEV
jgi:hypothetical protein